VSHPTAVEMVAPGQPQKEEHWGRRGDDRDRREKRKRSSGGVGQGELLWACWAARSPHSKAVWAAGGEVKRHKLDGLTRAH